MSSSENTARSSVAPEKSHSERLTLEVFARGKELLEEAAADFKLGAQFRLQQEQLEELSNAAYKRGDAKRRQAQTLFMGGLSHSFVSS
jgi:hypothetical protein